MPGYKGERWHPSTIKSILTNERYKGDALLQKSFIGDFLTKKQIRNHGQLPQYYVTASHEAIIDPDTWELVQYEVRARKGRRSPYAFSMKIKCSVCGGWYGSKTWHSNDKYRTTIWQCNNKYHLEHPSPMPHPTAEELEEYFTTELHELLASRPIITHMIQRAIETAINTSGLEEELTALGVKLEGLQALMDKAIRDNSRHVQNQDDYQQRFENLQTQYQETLDQYTALETEVADKNGRARQMRHILTTLNELNDNPIGFDFRLWHVLVDHILITPDGKKTIQWKWLDVKP